MSFARAAMDIPTAGTLLIVDDEAGVRGALRRLIRSEGYDVVTAADSREALHILESQAVDIIVCDQDLPGRSGTEFFTEIADRFPHQRRILLSGRFRSKDVAAALDDGSAHKFMMKPWDDAILKAEIRESFRHLMTSLNYQERISHLDHTENKGRRVTPDLTWTTFTTNRELGRELYSAAERGELNLRYQPQIDCETRSVSGFESLLRWAPRSGPVSPETFIAIAERSGSISKLTRWVVNEACFRLRRWREYWPSARLAINVSPNDLINSDIVHWVDQAIELNVIPTGSLLVEVTESRALETCRSSRDNLVALSKLGVPLVIDDFGAGATAIASLAQLPFSMLKFDRSLAEQAATPKGATVIRKIIEMCNDLDIRTTVEGVETEEQLERFASLGATTVQGYLYGPPMSAESVEARLAGEVRSADRDADDFGDLETKVMTSRKFAAIPLQEL
ncbi:MAG: EAL domain-containing response regulator [Pseudomonadota bacterium]